MLACFSDDLPGSDRVYLRGDPAVVEDLRREIMKIVAHAEPPSVHGIHISQRLQPSFRRHIRSLENETGARIVMPNHPNYADLAALVNASDFRPEDEDGIIKIYATQDKFRLVEERVRVSIAHKDCTTTRLIRHIGLEASFEVDDTPDLGPIANPMCSYDRGHGTRQSRGRHYFAG